MARWRLTGPHYLNVPGTEWEYQELDTRTGRPKRQRFAVPMYLDPQQPPNWDKPNGSVIELVVCHGTPTVAGDIEFVGEPTPDMVPLDDEAKAMSAKLEETKWNVKADTLTGSYGEHLERTLEKQLEQQMALVKHVTSQQVAPVPGMNDLLTAIAGMMAQNQEILARLSPPVAQPEPATAMRRV